MKHDALWPKVGWLTTFLMDDQGRKSDFERLIPIHPCAAYLAATISRQFSLAQRTLFRFLKQADRGSFPVFLHEHPKGDGGDRFWYTADALWDYFFLGDSLELPHGFRDVVNYYRSHTNSLTDEDERRVFKVIMLLLGLSKETPNVKRLRPTR